MKKQSQRWKVVLHKEDRNMKANHSMLLRMTKQTKSRLDEVWKNRAFPNPNNPKELIRFKSRQEFMEFCVGCIVNMGDLFWSWFANILNPSCPKELTPLFNLGLIKD